MTFNKKGLCMVGLLGVKLQHIFLQCIHHSVLIHSHTHNKTAYLVFLRNYTNKIQLKTRHWICILWSINEILWSEIQKGGEVSQIYTGIEKLSKQKIRQWRILVFSSAQYAHNFTAIIFSNLWSKKMNVHYKKGLIRYFCTTSK